MNAIDYIFSEDGKQDHGEWVQDCERLERVINELGYKVNTMQAYLIWYTLSDALGAHWLQLPKDDDELKRELVRDVEKRFGYYPYP